MTATERNYMWVKDHAFDIGSRKVGLASHCFSVGEVVEALGFSNTTVKKYINQMIENGVVRPVVFTKSITIYKFNRAYVESKTAGVNQS